MSHEANVILVAAGGGNRFGSEKQFEMLGGIPLYQHSLNTFANHPRIGRIALVVSAKNSTRIESEIAAHPARSRITLISGGETRQESVSNGLAIFAKADEYSIILVHDAARPFLSSKLISEIIVASELHGAAIAAIPVVDSLKKANDGFVNSSISRENLWRAQTPQAASAKMLRDAFQQAEIDGFTGTDESQLMERIGVNPYIVRGEEKNIKITHRADLEVTR
ncbi:MAG: 2-C-methyl-D-erythritol 4-phosphate cytidylyltransferase [bacterium]